MSTAQLTIELRPSRWLLSAVMATHALSAVGVWLTAMPWWAAAVVNTVLLMSAAYYAQALTNRAPRALGLTNGQWWLRDHRGERVIAWRGEALITPALLVLPYTDERRQRGSVVLPPDAGAAEDLRRLRVQLLNSPAVSQQ